MEYTFKYIKRTRELFSKLFDELSIEQVNQIPEGFNNNIAWNFGHIVVSTQSLCYLRTGIDKDIQIKYASKYTKGTKPESFITKEEIEELKEIAKSSIEKIEQDLKENKFPSIEAFPTATFGYVMETIEEVITCSLAHDTLHYGCALGLKKVVSSK